MSVDISLKVGWGFKNELAFGQPGKDESALEPVSLLKRGGRGLQRCDADCGVANAVAVAPLSRSAR